jgi:hypothetical protein
MSQTGVVCPKCGYTNRPGAKFCYECATNLLMAPVDSATAKVASPVTPTLPKETSKLTHQLDEATVGAILAGRYKILSDVGRGGMGAIYRAFDLRLQIIVAVKEMTMQGLGLKEQRDFSGMFRQEARLLAKLSHPGIAHVIDYIEENDKEFLVMEFVEGETLDQIQQRGGGALPESEVLAWASQMMDAIEYLHSQNPPIIHRDIKPGNFMLLPGNKIKLIDSTFAAP